MCRPVTYFQRSRSLWEVRALAAPFGTTFVSFPGYICIVVYIPFSPPFTNSCSHVTFPLLASLVYTCTPSTHLYSLRNSLTRFFFFLRQFQWPSLTGKMFTFFPNLKMLVSPEKASKMTFVTFHIVSKIVTRNCLVWAACCWPLRSRKCKSPCKHCCSHSVEGFWTHHHAVTSMVL